MRPSKLVAGWMLGTLAVFNGFDQAHAASSSCTKALKAADDLAALQTQTVRDMSDFVQRVTASPTSTGLGVAAAETGAKVQARQSAIEDAETRYAKFAKACRR